MNKRLMIWAVSLVALLLAACETQATNNDKNNKKENKMKTIELTKADFLKKVMDYETNPNEWKYLGDKPAIIDFYASWCGPCKMVAPILEELAEEYDGQIYIYKVNTEEEQELAGRTFEQYCSEVYGYVDAAYTYVYKQALDVLLQHDTATSKGDETA